MEEIERKFLMGDTFDINKLKECSKEIIEIKQGYITNTPEKTVRVRMGKYAYLTIKGKSTGISRSEFEYMIPLKEAQEMLLNFCEELIEKTRHVVEYKGKIWEIDVFHGKNEGLIVGEIELKDENEKFLIPSWIGKEVSDDERYYNALLLKNPYKEWE